MWTRPYAPCTPSSSRGRRVAEVSLRIVDGPERVAELRTEDMRAALAKRPDLVFVASTGRTPVQTYRAWGRAGLDLSKVHLRMLDAYLLSPSRGFTSTNHAGSFSRYVHESVLGPLDVAKRPRDWSMLPEDVATCEEVTAQLEQQPEAWDRVLHPISGEPGAEFVLHETATGVLAAIRRTCEAYDRLLNGDPRGIVSLGVGPLPYPHMAFNTGPFTRADAPTHLTLLDTSTRQANAEPFGDVDSVPPFALTLGPGTLVSAAVCWVSAVGASKSSAVTHALGDPRVPDFALRSSLGYVLKANHVDIVLDEAAAADITADAGLAGLEQRYREAGHGMAARRV